MHAISDYPITKRWPAAHPDRLQLYSLPTPNGVKVSIRLEEIGLPYEPLTNAPVIPKQLQLGLRFRAWSYSFSMIDERSMRPRGRCPLLRSLMG